MVTAKYAYMCGVCRQGMKSSAPSIACTACRYWIHLKCANLKFKEAKQICAKYVCVPCESKHHVETRKKVAPVDESAGEEEEEEEEQTIADTKADKRKTKRQKVVADKEQDKSLTMKKQRKLAPGDEGYDPYDFDSQGTDQATKAASTRRKSKTKAAEDATEEPMETDEPVVTTTITEERLQIFRSTLQGVFSEQHVQTLPLGDITARLDKDYPDAKFAAAEVNLAIERMTDDNQIMLSGGSVFLV